MPSGTPRLIDLGALAHRLGVAAAIVALVAAGVARRRGEPLSDQPGVAPPQLRRR